MFVWVGCYILTQFLWWFLCQFVRAQREADRIFESCNQKSRCSAFGSLKKARKSQGKGKAFGFNFFFVGIFSGIECLKKVALSLPTRLRLHRSHPIDPNGTVCSRKFRPIFCWINQHINSIENIGRTSSTCYTLCKFTNFLVVLNVLNSEKKMKKMFDCWKLENFQNSTWIKNSQNQFIKTLSMLSK